MEELVPERAGSSGSTATPSLDDRYLREVGPVYVSGLQALVRLPIDQQRRDRRSGLRVGTLISGYPGSPLSGYDRALREARPILEHHDIRHVPGGNEELAATALSGTQMLDHYPHSRYDGVVGIWYGKGPGVDRSGDALKHGNFAGTSRHGAVVVLSGEDHEAKSSTMPYQDDYAFAGHGIPVVYPATTGEFLTLGLHAIAMSRFSGCWVAMKLAAQLADGGETVWVTPDEPRVELPELDFDGKPFRKSTNFTFFPGLNIETERQLYYERHRAALSYARANQLDRAESGGHRLGLLSAGKSYTDLRQALLDLGVDEDALERLGVRLLRVRLIYPLDQEAARRLTRGLEQVIVVEEKRGFLEAQVKEALCGIATAPAVFGKHDERGMPLFPIQGGMDSDLVAEILGPRLLGLAADRPELAGRIRRGLERIRAVRERSYRAEFGRTPNYCSGCPHNVGTKLLPGETAWGSPGCHSFASIIEQPERHIVSMTQLGGEGLPWIGLQAYTDQPHMVQNVGDGSLFHSSLLNIRFCAAVGADITFKILYNGFMANTGAQELVGGMPVVELTRLLELEGVRRTVVLAKHPGAYRGARLATNCRVEPVSRQDAVLRELSAVSGVTVLIHDGLCSNERRRRQKRGVLSTPNRFVVINQEVCEGCGHCGALTNCMSLHPVETEFGSKTQIHASSCTQDLSCLGGDCPSFVTVETRPGTGYRKRTAPELEADAVPEPNERPGVDSPYRIYIPGVGGTGVTTLNAVLCWAALLDGLRAFSYDQTGAAQKWGPVLSSLTLAGPNAEPVANRVGLGQADLYLALDLLAAGTRVNLDRCEPRRTAAVINTGVLPSGEMVRSVDVRPPLDEIRREIERHTLEYRTISVDARGLAEGLFGDHIPTNILLLGVAFQAGLLPLSATAIEQAVRLNGVQIHQNLQAFRYGRLWVVDPGRVRARVAPAQRSYESERAAAMTRLSGRLARSYAALLDRCRDLDQEARRLLAIRVAELIDYQDDRYAAEYVSFVLEVAASERARHTQERGATHAVIRNLYKLMAYKDEYEVARLFLKPEFDAETRARFDAPRRIVWHFHPPFLRALGLQRKLRLGPWFRPVLRVLRIMRRLRGGPFDVFGMASVRREERRLIPWYRNVVREAMRTSGLHARAVEIARLPESIRGYEGIKLQRIAAARGLASEQPHR